MSSLSCGIVGLPNVGKSTIFCALTNAAVESANYPFTTIEPNVAIVNVPDSRLEILTKLLKSKKKISTTLKFVDIAGLVKGASKGEGLGNKFLGNIREVDAIIHVLRCFEGETTHVMETVDPVRDLEIINLELAISDLQILEKKKLKIEKAKKSGEKKSIREYEIIEKLINTINRSELVSLTDFDDIEDRKIIKDLNLISSKQTIYILNYGNESISSNKIKELKEIINNNKGSYVEIFGLLENEIKDLDEDEKQLFLNEYNIKATGLSKLIEKSYETLNLMTFYTAGPNESRAWSISNNTKAPAAAGKIHTDFEKGFIRAEVVEFNDFINCGSEEECKNKGKVRSEGKEYIVKDGDIVHFRYNV